MKQNPYLLLSVLTVSILKMNIHANMVCQIYRFPRYE